MAKKDQQDLVMSDIVSALLECSGTVVRYVLVRLTMLDAVTGTYRAGITLDFLPKAKVAIVWKSVGDGFHARSKMFSGSLVVATVH